MKYIALTLIMCVGLAGAPKNKVIFKKCEKLSRQLFNKNINDSKALELISFMKYLDSDNKKLKRLCSEVKAKKVEVKGEADVDDLVKDLLEKGEYYQEKQLKNRANIYYFMAYYLQADDEIEKKIEDNGFSTSSYPMISDLAPMAKKDKAPKKVEKKVVRTIELDKVNKVIRKELETSLARKKMEIDEEARIMKGSKQDIGYAERRTERIRASNERRRQKKEDFRKRAQYNGGSGRKP